jgi:hypothetical protein
MEPHGSLPHSKKPTTCFYPKSNPSSPCPQHTSLRSILISSSHLSLGLPSGLLPSAFPTKTLCALLRSPFVLHSLPISVSVTRSPEWYLVRNTKHKVPCHVVFSTERKWSAYIYIYIYRQVAPQIRMGARVGADGQLILLLKVKWDFYSSVCCLNDLNTPPPPVSPPRPNTGPK